MSFTLSSARRALLAGTAAFALVATLPGLGAEAKTRGLPKAEKVSATEGDIARLDADADAVLAALVDASPVAAEIAGKAAGIMVFPTVESNAFLIGSETAIGRPTADGETTYWRAERASLGLQMGSKSLSRVFMVMEPAILEKLYEGNLVNFGVDAEIVEIDTVTGTVEEAVSAEIAYFAINEDGAVYGLQLQSLEVKPISFTTK